MRFKSLALVLLSAFLISLSIPNELFSYGNPALGFIALVPLFVGLKLSPERKFAPWLGVIFGITSTLISYYWLMFFGDFSVWTIGGVTLGYAGYYALLFLCLRWLVGTPAHVRPFVLAAAWTAFEYLKSSGYLGYPWGLISYPVQNILPLIQIADIFGVWGVSFIMALANSLIAETLSPFDHSREAPLPGSKKAVLSRQWAVYAALIAGTLIYGGFRLAAPLKAEKNLSVVLVQHNLDAWLAGNDIPGLKTGQRLTREGLAAADRPVDMVVWSETAINRPLDEYRNFYAKNPPGDGFIPFIRGLGTYLLVGSPYVVNWENGDFMNAVLLVDPGTKIVSVYGKQHPVPLAESVPFWDIPAVQAFFTKVIGLYSRGWYMGTEYTVMKLPLKTGGTLSFGAPICFEDAFPYLCRRFVKNGAEMLINLTNDSWSKTDSAQIQHFVAARFRSVENRTVLIRSTNAGVTSIIDPRGRIMHMLPFFTEAYLAADIPIYNGDSVSFYTRFGDYLPWLCMAACFAVLIIRRIRYRAF